MNEENQKIESSTDPPHVDEETPFLTNDQLPEAELYDGNFGEIQSPLGTAAAMNNAAASAFSHFNYEIRQVHNFEVLERERL